MCSELDKINALRLDQQYDEARARIEAFVGENPDEPDGHNAHGVILRELGDPEGSVTAFERTLELNELSTKYQTNLGMSHLHLENWEPGWELFESRFSDEIPQTLLDDVPFWDGTARTGLRLLVFQEQGQGDAIQFSRFIRLLSERGIRVTFWCSLGLQTLMDASKHILGMERVWSGAEGECIDGEYDAQIPLMSLPHVLKCYERFPLGLPFSYLGDPGELPGEPLPETPNQRRIAIAWSCKKKSADFSARSCPLHYFEPLTTQRDLALWSVQKPYRDDTDGNWLRDHGVLDLQPRLENFQCTEAILKQVSAVVTVDTSVAHLAGALGLPTIVMLRMGADWRWHRHAETMSPWYRNTHLVRQTRPNDWEDVVRRVQAMLNASPFI